MADEKTKLSDVYGQLLMLETMVEKLNEVVLDKNQSIGESANFVKNKGGLVNSVALLLNALPSPATGKPSMFTKAKSMFGFGARGGTRRRRK